jgi:hypothetical protein
MITGEKCSDPFSRIFVTYILVPVGVTSFSALAAAVLPLSNLSDDHFLPVYCVDTRPFLEMHISSGTGCGVVAQ